MFHEIYSKCNPELKERSEIQYQKLLVDARYENAITKILITKFHGAAGAVTNLPKTQFVATATVALPNVS